MRSVAEVREMDDDSAIARLLDRDRLWAAYGICDLEPPYRQHARYIACLRGGVPVGILLLYASPVFTAIMSFGDDAAVATIAHQAERLPLTCDLLVRWEHRTAFHARYTFSREVAMDRMAITPRDLQPLTTGVVPTRLHPSDAPEIQALYDHSEEGVFDPQSLEAGLYYGVRRQGDLVAVAGTHAVSHRFHIATVGGVCTRPDFRGQGLATATTREVTAALMENGIRDVVLNVRADNTPAIAAYRRVGYRHHLNYLEARGVASPVAP